MDRSRLKDKKRIVVKIGSSSLTHPETGEVDLIKLEKLVRELCDYCNRGIEVVLVSSGAIAVGAKTLGFKERPQDTASKQACASVGQARLMMIYQKLFAEYNHVASQILITKNTMLNPISRENAQNTFMRLLELGVIPIVNENDTVSTYELQKLQQFGDNDTLSAIVAAMIGADLLILLSDIDGLYTDDPRQNPNAVFIETVEKLDDTYMKMGKASTGSNVGTGGMNTKMIAAKIATSSGADMIIANSSDIRVIHRIIDGRNYGTLFLANKEEQFDLPAFVNALHK
jgi:glutamate 5-kinase